jgi:hypothetical protein
MTVIEKYALGTSGIAGLWQLEALSKRTGCRAAARTCGELSRVSNSKLEINKRPGDVPGRF